MAEISWTQIPRPIQQVFFSLRDRILEIKKKYKSLANYGYPPYESIQEIAVIYGLIEFYGFDYNTIARELGLDKTSIYRLMKRIRTKGVVQIFDRQEGKAKAVEVNHNMLMDIFNELREGKGMKKDLADITQAKVIQEWLKNPVKRASKSLVKKTLSERDIRLTLRTVQRVAELMKQEGYPSNPDLWEESTVRQVLEKHITDIKKLRRVKMILRRVWNNWFEGELGAATKFINPKETVLYYEDYLKIRKMYKEGKIPKEVFTIIALHITTGAREGLKASEEKSSLWGLTWNNMVIRNEKVETIYIYESKTLKTWTLKFVDWLEPDLPKLLYEYFNKRKDNNEKVVTTITGINNKTQFFKWYKQWLKKISEMLKLPYTLKPHDMRRSHISILAELEVPLEIAVTDNGFGVGWEDLKTAVVYYLRFSKRRMERVLQQIQSIKREIEATTT